MTNTTKLRRRAKIRATALAHNANNGNMQARREALAIHQALNASSDDATLSRLLDAAGVTLPQN